MADVHVPAPPQIGLFACSSAASNTGSLAAMASLEVVRQLGSSRVGICSLPALLAEVPRQTTLVRKIERIVVVDGCHNACAKRLLAGRGVQPDVYVNLEQDLGIAKLGPFTSLEWTAEEVQTVAAAIIVAIGAEEVAGGQAP
jgi:uncharacterized metal-binding protein